MRKKNIYYRSIMIALGMALLTMFNSASAVAKTAPPAPDFYATQMVEFISRLHNYAQRRRPEFVIMTNGGVNLFLESANNNAANVQKLQRSIDGVMTESVFYGYDMQDNAVTPSEDSAYFLQALQVPQQAGIACFNIDYCNDKALVDKSRQQNSKANIISWAAPSRNLDILPLATNFSPNDVTKLSQVKSFVALLNPEHYQTLNDYQQALQQSNYDLIIMDAYYGEKVLPTDVVQSLKTRADGTRRLVLAYLSIGEAETYRSYWQSAWSKNPPTWLRAANDDWAGNYKVQYWRDEWQQLIYGRSNSELDKIMAAGFDGVFLDVVDAYEYFQTQ